VQMIRPDAVTRGEDGYLLVNYERLGLRMETWEEWVAEQEGRSRPQAAGQTISASSEIPIQENANGPR